MKKKEGRFFFIFLLVVSGLAIFSLLFLAFEGDKVTLYSIEKFVVDSGIFEKALSDDMKPEEKRRILLNLHQFFSSAKSGVESKERIAEVGGKLREIMEDNKITKEEAQELENLLLKNRPKP